MSVDTKTSGRDLRPYRRLPAGEHEVLITPELAALANVLAVDTGGVLGRRLHIEFLEPLACEPEPTRRSRRTR